MYVNGNIVNSNIKSQIETPQTSYDLICLNWPTTKLTLSQIMIGSR